MQHTLLTLMTDAGFISMRRVRGALSLDQALSYAIRLKANLVGYDVVDGF